MKNYFPYEEFIISRDYPAEARKIQLSKADKNNIDLLVSSCLLPARVMINSPFNILSGKRSIRLNQLVGGSANSDHLYSNVIDFTVSYISIIKVFCKIVDLNIPYRQLMVYPSHNFIHLSCNIPGKKFKHESFFIE